MKKLSVLFAAVLMFMSVGVAKAQKVASLNVAEVLSLMPEKKKADEQLTAFRTTKEAEIKKQMESYQATVQKYYEEAPKQTQQVNDTRTAELQKLQQNIQQMTVAAEKDMAGRMDTAYAPIEKKFNDAVSKVAKANGWDFVFDSNSDGLIYKGGPDATPAVKKELGL